MCVQQQQHQYDNLYTHTNINLQFQLISALDPQINNLL